MLIALKLIFLALGVAYGFSNLGRIYYKTKVHALQVWLMTIGIVGFVAIQFDLWK